MTRQVYLDELDKLHKKVVEMGTLIEESLDQVEEALYKMNREKAREIIAGDDRVDAMEREILRVCRQRPYSGASCRARAQQFEKTRCLREYLRLYRDASAGRMNGSP